MRTRPLLDEEALLCRLRAGYGLPAAAVTFLPLGADYATALYRAETARGERYFCRLRSGPWNEAAVALPAALQAAGIREAIAPLRAEDGRLAVPLGAYTLSVWPWVDGRNGYEAPLEDAQWVALGAAVRRIHEAALPAALWAAIPEETYPARWRERLQTNMAGLEAAVPMDDLAARALEGLRARRAEIAALLARLLALQAVAPAGSARTVLCHTDLHAGNVLLDAAGRLYLVDWDAPLRAPRERDLMYAGGGQFGDARPPAAEEALFYAGYGDVPVDRARLAYYRYARIVEDLAIYADDLLQGDPASPDRADALQYMLANFQAGGTLAIARAADTGAGGQGARMR